MEQQYFENQAVVIESNLSAAAVIQSTPTETIKSILGRMGVEYTEGFPKEVYISALLDTLTEDYRYILYFLTKNTVEFLLEVWECDGNIVMEEQDWESLQYLKIFGFLTYKKGNKVQEKANEIYIIPEQKEAFYFLLKSKKTQKLMHQYEEWEFVCAGLVFYYGFLNVETFYERFGMAMNQILPYEEFVSFVKCRTSMWGIFAFLTDNMGLHEYVCSVEIDNPDILLQFIRENSIVPFKNIKKEDLIYVSRAGGIDNRWKGISELGLLLVEEMKVDYYRATILIHTLVRKIQNSKSLEQVQQELCSLHFNSEKEKEEVRKAVELLYNGVPLFEYKGHSREEIAKQNYQKQLKKRRNMFKIIKGGS